MALQGLSIEKHLPPPQLIFLGAAFYLIRCLFQFFALLLVIFIGEICFCVYVYFQFKNEALDAHYFSTHLIGMQIYCKVGLATNNPTHDPNPSFMQGWKKYFFKYPTHQKTCSFFGVGGFLLGSVLKCYVFQGKLFLRQKNDSYFKNYNGAKLCQRCLLE